MLFHGLGKILNPGSIEFIGGQLTVLGLSSTIAYGVYVGEVVAPLMIILGVFSRIGGLIIAGNMVFAIVLVHTNDLLSLSQNGGWVLELQGFYLFCGLAIFFLGSGRVAIRPD